MPKIGVIDRSGLYFRDITTLLKASEGFNRMIDLVFERHKDADIDKVVGIENRRFIIGSNLIYKLKEGFVPIRKR